MEENGKKWKKRVVDVQIEGVLVRSYLDGGNDSENVLYLYSGGDLVLMVEMIPPRYCPRILRSPKIFPIIVQDILYDHSNI